MSNKPVNPATGDFYTQDEAVAAVRAGAELRNPVSGEVYTLADLAAIYDAAKSAQVVIAEPVPEPVLAPAPAHITIPAPAPTLAPYASGYKPIEESPFMQQVQASPARSDDEYAILSADECATIRTFVDEGRIKNALLALTRYLGPDTARPA